MGNEETDTEMAESSMAQEQLPPRPATDFHVASATQHHPYIRGWQTITSRRASQPLSFTLHPAYRPYRMPSPSLSGAARPFKIIPSCGASQPPSGTLHPPYIPYPMPSPSGAARPFNGRELGREQVEIFCIMYDAFKRQIEEQYERKARQREQDLIEALSRHVHEISEENRKLREELILRQEEYERLVLEKSSLYFVKEQLLDPDESQG